MEYEIIGTSKNGKEIIDTADNKELAESMVREYQLAFGSDFNIAYQISQQEETEEKTLHSARLREAGISNDYYENGDEFDEGDSSYDEHYGY